MFHEKIILLPTLINMNAASTKLKKLKINLLLFNKLIPKRVLQKPIETKINGKYTLGFILLVIIFNDKIDSDTAHIILTKLKLFLIILDTTFYIKTYVSYFKLYTSYSIFIHMKRRKNDKKIYFVLQAVQNYFHNGPYSSFYNIHV